MPNLCAEMLLLSLLVLLSWQRLTTQHTFLAQLGRVATHVFTMSLVLHFQSNYVDLFNPIQLL